MNREDIKNELIASITRYTGVFNKFKEGSYTWIYGLLEGFAGILSRLYIMSEKFFQRKLIFGEMNIEDLKNAGSRIGISINSATTANGYVNIQGTIGTVIDTTITLTNGDNVYYNTSEQTISTITGKINSITRNGTIATVITSISHTLATGQKVNILGADNNNFNVTDTIITVISQNEFTYSVVDTGSTTANGDLSYSSNYARLFVISQLTGFDKNIANSSTLNVSSSILNIDNNAYISLNGIYGGTDEEATDNFLKRVEAKYAYNINPFSTKNIKNTLIAKFPEINDVKNVKGFSSSVAIKKIRFLTAEEKILYPDFNNNFFRVVETANYHGITKIGNMINITGANNNNLNIPHYPIERSLVYHIIDSNNIIVFVLDSTHEDTTSTNMRLIPFFRNISTLFVIKNDLIKYPSSEELQKYKQFILDEMDFADYNNFYIKAPNKRTISFHITGLNPLNNTIKDSIKANFKDYWANFVYIGFDITKAQYSNIVYNSRANGQQVITANIVCKVDGTIVEDIIISDDEYADLNIDNITFS